MNLFPQWRKREEDPDSVIARSLAHRISERADALTMHLKTYERSRNPFSAMLADMYNSDQVDKIYRGPEA
jgi:hypothetical protein